MDDTDEVVERVELHRYDDRIVLPANNMRSDVLTFKVWKNADARISQVVVNVPVYGEYVHAMKKYIWTSTPAMEPVPKFLLIGNSGFSDKHVYGRNLHLQSIGFDEELECWTYDVFVEQSAEPIMVFKDHEKLMFF